MANGLYLGRQVDAKGKPGERTLLDPSDLLTHGLVVGMTARERRALRWSSSRRSSGRAPA